MLGVTVSGVYQAMASLPSRLAMAGNKDMDERGAILVLEPVMWERACSR
jgi:hypothetical protein